MPQPFLTQVRQRPTANPLLPLVSGLMRAPPPVTGRAGRPARPTPANGIRRTHGRNPPTELAGRVAGVSRAGGDDPCLTPALARPCGGLLDQEDDDDWFDLPEPAGLPDYDIEMQADDCLPESNPRALGAGGASLLFRDPSPDPGESGRRRAAGQPPQARDEPGSDYIPRGGPAAPRAEGVSGAGVRANQTTGRGADRDAQLAGQFDATVRTGSSRTLPPDVEPKDLDTMTHLRLRQVQNTFAKYEVLESQVKSAAKAIEEEFEKAILRLAIRNQVHSDVIHHYLNDGRRIRGPTAYNNFFKYDPRARAIHKERRKTLAAARSAKAKRKRARREHPTAAFMEIEIPPIITLGKASRRIGRIWHRELSDDEREKWGDLSYVESHMTPNEIEARASEEEAGSPSEGGPPGAEVAGGGDPAEGSGSENSDGETCAVKGVRKRKRRKLPVSEWANKVMLQLKALRKTERVEGILVVYPLRYGGESVMRGTPLGEEWLAVCAAEETRNNGHANQFMGFARHVCGKGAAATLLGDRALEPHLLDNVDRSSGKLRVAHIPEALRDVYIENGGKGKLCRMKVCEVLQEAMNKEAVVRNGWPVSRHEEELRNLGLKISINPNPIGLNMEVLCKATSKMVLADYLKILKGFKNGWVRIARIRPRAHEQEHERASDEGDPAPDPAERTGVSDHSTDEQSSSSEDDDGSDVGDLWDE